MIDPNTDHDYHVPHVKHSVWTWRAVLLCLVLLSASCVYSYGLYMNRYCGGDLGAICQADSFLYYIAPALVLAVSVALVTAVTSRMLHPWVRRTIFLLTAIIVVSFVYVVFRP